LFGGWVIASNWGGVGQPAGQRRTTPVNNYKSGLQGLASIEKVREKRQYIGVN
jgi:hypothetical protein